MRGHAETEAVGQRFARAALPLLERQQRLPQRQRGAVVCGPAAIEPSSPTAIAGVCRSQNALARLFVPGCIKQSVLDAIRQGFKVTVLHDGIAGVDVRPGDSERAIAEMRDAGAVMMSAPRDETLPA